MPSITGKARLAGVMGHPVSHSMSPALHRYWLDEYAIDGAYVPLHVLPERLEEALKALPALGFRGCNLTLPHKEQAVQLMDNLDAQAKAIGAVNTVVVREDGTLEGRNTDGFGFVANLKQHAVSLDLTRCHAMIIGAGGAAKAVIAGLIDEGCLQFVLTNRTASKAEAIALHMQHVYRDKPALTIKVVDWEARDSACSNITLLVNTTQLGMQGQPPLPFDLSALSSNCIVTDIVYTPLKTPLLLDAEQRGLATVDGLGMLLWQAAAGFEAWFGTPPTVTKALRAHMLSLMEA